MRRCESIDNGMDLVSSGQEMPTVSFPKNIKTVSRRTILDLTVELGFSLSYVGALREIIFLKKRKYVRAV